MKAKLKYEYDASLITPYVAWLIIGEEKFCAVSAVSYEKAKEKVIQAVKEQINQTVKVPESEEVEL